MIEPISVCELEDGRPKYQVPRFQMIAAINSANTMAKPAPLPTCRISSTGSSEMMPKATAPLEISTPRKLQHARPDHRDDWRQGMGVDHRGHGVGGIVEAVDEFEAQRDEQGDAEQDVGKDPGVPDHR